VKMIAGQPLAGGVNPRRVTPRPAWKGLNRE
jgi:hypothetical protein